MKNIRLKKEYDIVLRDYHCACEALLHIFCEKHKFNYYDARWIADRPGEWAEIADYCVDMSTIVDDVQLKADEKEFEEWYDYAIKLGGIGVTELPNFRSWVKGCPRKSQAEIEELSRIHQNVEEAKQNLMDAIEDFNHTSK